MRANLITLTDKVRDQLVEKIHQLAEFKNVHRFNQYKDFEPLQDITDLSAETLWRIYNDYEYKRIRESTYYKIKTALNTLIIEKLGPAPDVNTTMQTTITIKADLIDNLKNIVCEFNSAVNALNEACVELELSYNEKGLSFKAYKKIDITDINEPF